MLIRRTTPERKAWKYNNNYVECDDLYRHSKRLAMMERRLLIAKELFNPADSTTVTARQGKLKGLGWVVTENIKLSEDN